MYWNSYSHLLITQGFWINRNMRCIEIPFFVYSDLFSFWLIETWDVLKLFLALNASPSCERLIETWDVLKFRGRVFRRIRRQINRNMRCIEMQAESRRKCQPGRINRNMRCIEIFLNSLLQSSLPWLIETWDVLKCCQVMPSLDNPCRLIETWDVLK